MLYRATTTTYRRTPKTSREHLLAYKNMPSAMTVSTAAERVQVQHYDDEIIVEFRSPGSDPQRLSVYFSRAELVVGELLPLVQEQARLLKIIGEHDSVTRLKYPCGVIISTNVPVPNLIKRLLNLGSGVYALADTATCDSSGASPAVPEEVKRQVAQQSSLVDSGDGFRWIPEVLADEIPARNRSHQLPARDNSVIVISSDDEDVPPAGPMMTEPTTSAQVSDDARTAPPPTPEMAPAGGLGGCEARGSRKRVKAEKDIEPCKRRLGKKARDAPTHASRGGPSSPQLPTAIRHPSSNTAAAGPSSRASTEDPTGRRDSPRLWVAVGEEVHDREELIEHMKHKLGEPPRVRACVKGPGSLQKAIDSAKQHGGGTVLVLGLHRAAATLHHSVDLWGCPERGTDEWGDMPPEIQAALPAGFGGGGSILKAKELWKPILAVEGSSSSPSSPQTERICRIRSLQIHGVGEGELGRPRNLNRQCQKKQGKCEVAGIVLGETSGDVSMKNLKIDLKGWGFGVLMSVLRTPREPLLKKTQVTMEGCDITDACRSGVCADGALVDLTMRHCRVLRSGAEGVFVGRIAGRCMISHCRISEFGCGGVRCFASEPMTIEHTEISGGGFSLDDGAPAPGVISLHPNKQRFAREKVLDLLSRGWEQRLREQGHTFRCNNIHNNKSCGIVMLPGVRCVMEGNIVHKNAEVGVWFHDHTESYQETLEKPSPHKLKGNTITGNGDAGIVVVPYRLGEFTMTSATAHRTLKQGDVERFLCGTGNMFSENKQGGFLVAADADEED